MGKSPVSMCGNCQSGDFITQVAIYGCIFAGISEYRHVKQTSWK
jgi:hypothetical protein